ncbi:MAG: glycosyltransferase family 2 protein [Methyloceanibacter sp.]
MDTTPRLSIIVATWNAARTFERCLHSVIGQDFTAWELLVADGASTDGMVDLIRQHESHIAWWQSRQDDGIYDAWNHALAHARGEYVVFLGADDAFHAPDTLQRIFDAIGDEEYDLVTTRGVMRDAEWRPLSEAGGPWNYDAMPRRMGVLHPGLLHRRDLFERYGLFDPSLRIVGDLEFLLRMPRDLRTLDLAFPTVDVQNDGISRQQFWCRLRERRQVHVRAPRVGRLRACLYWLDKAWRMPIARALGLPH